MDEKTSLVAVVLLDATNGPDEDVTAVSPGETRWDTGKAVRRLGRPNMPSSPRGDESASNWLVVVFLDEDVKGIVKVSRTITGLIKADEDPIRETRVVAAVQSRFMVVVWILPIANRKVVLLWMWMMCAFLCPPINSSENPFAPWMAFVVGV